MSSKYYNTSKPSKQFRYPIGTIVYHTEKGRPNRIRPNVQTDRGVVDAPSYYYEYVYKLGHINNDECIMSKNGNRCDLSKDNLVKIKLDERNYIISTQTNVYDFAIKDPKIFKTCEDLAKLHTKIKEVEKRGRSKRHNTTSNRKNERITSRQQKKEKNTRRY